MIACRPVWATSARKRSRDRACKKVVPPEGLDQGKVVRALAKAGPVAAQAVRAAPARRVGLAKAGLAESPVGRQVKAAQVPPVVKGLAARVGRAVAPADQVLAAARKVVQVVYPEVAVVAGSAKCRSGNA